MTSIWLRLLLVFAVFTNFSCKDRLPPETSTTSAAEIINAGSKGIYVIRPFNEVWSKRKNEAVNVAFDMVTDEIRKRFPNVDVKGGVDFFKSRVDMHNVEDGAKRFLEANVNELEGLGLQVVDFIPSAFMFVFSGPLIEELFARANLPVTTDVLLTLVVVPKFVQRYVPGKKQVMESWRFQLGAGLLTFARLKSKEAGDSSNPAYVPSRSLRVGMGFIWGEVQQPSDLSGKLAGVAMSRATWRIPGSSTVHAMPFGNNAKVFALSSAKNGWLQDETGKISLFKVTNIMATFEYIFGETRYDYIHPYVGVSLAGDQLLTYLLGVGELPSEETPSDGTIPDVEQVKSQLEKQ